MFRENTIQKITSTLFSGVYLFIVLFSQNFHEHHRGDLFKNFHFKKSEKTFTSSHATKAYSDCLSCHFTHDGNAFLTKNNVLVFQSTKQFKKSVFNYSIGAFCSFSFYFQKRGPPFNFI